MTRYSTGAAFEREVQRDMQSKGYHAIRAAGSHSPVDVYCISRYRLVYIQCKTNGRVDPDEWNSFFDYCLEVGAAPIVASRPRITYREITGYKDGSKKKQPWEEVKL